MKKKPSLDAFRSGGGEGQDDSQSSTVAPAPAPAPVTAPMAPGLAERANKTIRIRKDFEKKLKEVAYHRSLSDGRRITESDIIDEALEQYFISK